MEGNQPNLQVAETIRPILLKAWMDCFQALEGRGCRRDQILAAWVMESIALPLTHSDNPDLYGLSTSTYQAAAAAFKEYLAKLQLQDNQTLITDSVTFINGFIGAICLARHTAKRRETQPVRIDEIRKRLKAKLRTFNP